MAMARPFLRKKLISGSGDGGAEPGKRARQGTCDALLVIGLAGQAFVGRRFTHEHERDVAGNDHRSQHQEGHLPVVGETGILEPLGRLEGDDSADLVAGPPAHHGRGRTGGHRLALSLADLLDPQGIDGDVLGRRGNGDDEADSDHRRKVGKRIDETPDDQTGENDHLEDDDPRAPVTDQAREPRYPDAIDERRPQEVEGVDAEDEAGPAYGAAGKTVLLEPQVEAAADQNPGKPADDAQEEDAGHAGLEVVRERIRQSWHTLLLNSGEVSGILDSMWNEPERRLWMNLPREESGNG